MIPFETSPSIFTQSPGIFSLARVPTTTERLKRNRRAVDTPQRHIRPASDGTSHRAGACGPGQQVALCSSPARLNGGLVLRKRRKSGFISSRQKLENGGSPGSFDGPKL